MKWKDKNGVIWNLKDMDEAHVKNCIKYLARHPNAENRFKIDEFRYELQCRLDEFNSEVDLIMQENSSLDRSTVLCKLQDEIDKRVPDITGAPMGRATAYCVEGLRIAMRVVHGMKSDLDEEVDSRPACFGKYDDVIKVCTGSCSYVSECAEAADYYDLHHQIN